MDLKLCAPHVVQYQLRFCGARTSPCTPEAVSLTNGIPAETGRLWVTLDFAGARVDFSVQELSSCGQTSQYETEQ